MAESMESRMVRVETKIENYESTQNAIFEYMRKGHIQRDEMLRGFTELLEQSKTTLKYQQDCDAERKSLKTRLQNIENTRIRAVGFSAGVSFILTGVLGGIAWVLKGGN